MCVCMCVCGLDSTEPYSLTVAERGIVCAFVSLQVK